MSKIPYSKLLKRVRKRACYKQEIIDDVVNAFLKEVVQLLNEGNEVEIQRFGKFRVAIHAAREGVNIHGESIRKREKRIIRFKNSHTLIAFLNPEVRTNHDGEYWND